MEALLESTSDSRVRLDKSQAKNKSKEKIP
jgi:hypothetical protein